MKTIPNNIRLILMQCIGLILSGCTIYGYAPIGVGYFCALYSTGHWKAVTCISMIIGLTYSVSYISLIKYLMVMTLFVIISEIIKYKNNSMSVYVYGLVNFISMAALEMTDRLTITVNTADDIITAIGVCVLSGAVMIVFRRGIDGLLNAFKNNQLQNEEMIGIAAISGTGIYVMLMNVELPYAILESVIYFILLYCTYRYGAGMGAITGTALGISLGIRYDNVNIVAIVCVAAIVAGGLSELGRIATVIAMVCSMIIGGIIYVPELINETNVQGLLTAAVIFLILPMGFVFRENDNMSDDREGNQMQSINSNIHDRINLLSQSVKMICESMHTEPDYHIVHQDKTHQVQEGMMKICKNCSEHGQCICRATVLASLLSGEKIKNDSKCIHSDEIENEVRYILESSRINLIWQKRMEDMKNNLSVQLREISELLDNYVMKKPALPNALTGKHKSLQRRLKRRGVNICAFEEQTNELGMSQLAITLKCNNGRIITSREINDIVNESMNMDMVPDKDDCLVVGSEYKTMTFRQKENFILTCAVSRKNKGDGEISGDTPSVTEMGNGKWMVTLADGMGSGLEASKDSEHVVEFIERMVSTGFSREGAVNMLNSVKNINWEDERTTSIDMGVVDMYSGRCDFVKLGAASTFIKRDKWVDVIRSTSCPMGIIGEADVDSVTKKLYSGDMIVMMSDGVLDGIRGDNKELEISRILLNYDNKSPKELADRILDKAMEDSYYTPADDMTVVVAALVENVKSA